MAEWALPRRFPQALLAGALLFAAACQPQAAPAPPGPAAPGAPAPAATAARPAGPTGKLTVAVAQPLITSLDTGFGNDAQTLQFMWPAFDGLTWLSADGKVNPGLAKEWKSVNDTTWEFTLGDYKFHNGRAVEAQDVMDTFKRSMDPEKKLPGRSMFAGVGVTDVTAPSAKVVRVVTGKPNPTIPNIIQLAMVLPMKELNAAGDIEFFRKPIGTGPFKVELGDFQGGKLQYTAMGADFVSPRGVPKLKDLEIRIVPEISSRLAALRTGDVDLALALTVDNRAQLDAANLKTFTSNGTSTIQFNLDWYAGPTSNLKVRQAMNYAIDKDTVLRVFYGGLGRVDTAQLIGPSVLGFNPSLQAYPFDRTKSKALLTEAGYPNGFPIKMTIINLSTVNTNLAQIIADQLKEVGIQVELVVKETAIWLTDYYGSPDKRAGIFTQVINFDQTFEPDSVYRWFSSDVPLDGGRRWQDEQFDKLYQTAHSELDRTKRGTDYQAAAAYLNANAPVIFGWQINGVFGGKQNVTVGQPAHADFYITAAVN